MSLDTTATRNDRRLLMRRTYAATALLCLIACTPGPVAAQAWTTIRAAPAAPPSPAIDDQVAANRDDIRAGRRAGQLSRAEARYLRRENGRAAAIAATGTGPGDPATAFAARTAEATHGLIVAGRTKGSDRPPH